MNQRHKILNWLKANLTTLPLPTAVEAMDLENLLAEKHQYPTLLLVRQAMNQLNPELNF